MQSKVIPTHLIATAQTPREFLHALFQSMSKKPSLGEVCKRCGLNSKSYLSEVMNGKKLLSLESANKLAHGLKLNVTLTKFLETLILSERAQQNGNQREWERFQNLLERQRKKFQQKNSVIDSTQINVEEIVEHRIIFEIFAGLGSEVQGASLEEIQMKTKLSSQQISPACKLLVKHGYIEARENRFYVKANGVDFKNLNFSLNFAKAFSEEASHISRHSQRLIATQEALCLYGAFSIDPQKQIEFKEKLRDLLLEFMNEVENDNGSKVAKICCAFY